jgi:hypothetical protein
MIERRETRRRDVNVPVKLSMEGMEIRARMINFSGDGALFVIDAPDAEKVSTMDLGKEASFLLRLRGRPVRKYTGELIRFFYKGEGKHVVLRFWEGFEELSS